jgi:FixJ family two-component response regulator
MSYVQTIHVIDDDATVRFALQILLGAEGYVVQSHESAHAFLNTIQKDDIGCVVTDVKGEQDREREEDGEHHHKKFYVPSLRRAVWLSTKALPVSPAEGRIG